MRIEKSGWPRLVGLAASAIVALATSACGQKLAEPAAATKPLGVIGRDRLLAADASPGDWLTSGRDFGKTHFSSLTQIDRDSAKRLGFAWDYKTNTTRGLEATPIVVDGVMYTSGSTGKVYALRADTGEQVWAFDPRNDGQVSRYACCDDVNRGVAVFDGLVYVASLDGRLFALERDHRRTGVGTGHVLRQDTRVHQHRRSRSGGQRRRDRQCRRRLRRAGLCLRVRPQDR